ncbi:hypothetical protein [Nioella sp.]|uniref:hypothetical protein n=1 Tax=Nioella sp. TaxID=1912091 RepID=UPI003A89FA31
MTSETTEAPPQNHQTPHQRATFTINRVTAEDIRASLKAGFADFLARPVMSGFFGLFYALFGVLFIWALVWLGKIWMVIPPPWAFRWSRHSRRRGFMKCPAGCRAANASAGRTSSP